MKKLENKIALITGGSTGIGQTTALTFANEGAKVLITGRNEETLKISQILAIMKSHIKISETVLPGQEMSNTSHSITVMPII